MRFALVLLVSSLGACGHEPPPAARDVAANALDCGKWDITFRSYDDDGATAECNGRGAFLERAGDQWIVMQSFPIAPE